MSLSNKWTLLGAMNFAVAGTTGVGSQTCANSIDTVQDGVSWKGMAGYNGANGWTFTLPNTWKGQNLVMAPYYKNGGVLFAGWGCRDISGQLGTNATYPGRRTATNGSVYPFMWADTLGGIAQNGSFTWEHAFPNLDPSTTYKFQYLTVLAAGFCSLENITTTGTRNGASHTSTNLAVTNNAAKTKGSQLVTSTVSGVTEYSIVRKGSGVGCNHMALSAIQVHASATVPQISSLSTTSGPRSGGTVTTINGNNLATINSVTIGGNAAIIESTSESSVNVVTPAGSVGAANIVIGDGTDTTTMTGGFTYTNQTAPSLQLSLDGASPATVYGATRTITAQVSTAGLVTFKSGGVAITGCSNVASTASRATCSWLVNAANSNTRLTADFVPTDSVAYTNLSGAGVMTVDVTKASAVVIASSPAVQYGDAVPAISHSVVGLVNSDAPAVVSGLSCSTSYTNSSSVGSSPTTSCSGGISTNYSLSYTAGSVTVSPATQSSLSLVAASFKYGQTLSLDAGGGSGSGDYSYSLSSSGSAGCTRSGIVISASSTGTCTVSVTRADSTNYLSKSQIFIITVGAAPQTAISITTSAGTIDTSLELAITGGSGSGNVTWSVTDIGTARCGVIGSTLLAAEAGTCVVQVTKDAEDNYLAASATKTISIAARDLSSGGQNSAPSVTAPATITTVAINAGSPAVKSPQTTVVTTTSLAPLKSGSSTSTSTTTVPIQNSLAKTVESISASEALMMQGDSMLSATVTRENNALIMNAGLFKAVVRGLDTDGNTVPLDAKGDIRIPRGGSILVDMGRYLPDSEVLIWMFSTPKSLGERLVDAKGNIVSEIKTPKDASEGLHRIAFIGKNPRGDEITFMVGLIVADPPTLSTTSKILIAIPLTLAIFLGFLLPTTWRRRQRGTESGLMSAQSR